MQFKLTFVTILSTVVAAVNGAAVIKTRADQTTQAAQVDGHIFVCTDGNFAGDCTNWGFTAGVCSTFTSEFQDDISSIGPDQGWSCDAYVNSNCDDSAGHLTVRNPGISDLDKTGWNDKISSVRCNRV